ncbi:NAD dependent epimerase/dehydratase family protein [Phlegmacium glaucopus]|nr:NAD dependent epimerase/dehydratase family protein [Phlegmacium glaucopus]
MRVFLTGGTGFIGSAIVKDLLAAGHQLVGLARSDTSAKLLESLGVEVLRGSIDDLDSLKRGAADSDAVIHCAFIHDFSDYAGSIKKDHLAIQTLGAALEGTNRPLVVTSGTLSLSSNGLATEQDLGDPLKLPRAVGEEITLSFFPKGVHSSVIRLPPSVHDKGDYGFIPMLIAIAREKGVSAYIGDGLNRWPSVHRVDAAHLYRLVLEKGTAGARYHGVADEGVPFRDIAQLIGKHLNIPVVSKPIEEAVDHFGWFGHFVGYDNPTSSKRTQQELGWHPSQISLLADIEQNYF